MALSDRDGDVIRVRLDDQFAQIETPWTPLIVGALNGQYVKLAKFDREYTWHHHEHEDEMFLVIKGHVDIHLRSRVISLEPGEFCIVPRGVEHRPVSAHGASVLLFEPAGTRSTGNVDDARTVETMNLEWGEGTRRSEELP